MNLKARTTYRTKGGSLVHIAGPLRNPGYEGFWSIEGNHYTTDGRLWSLRRIATPVGKSQRYERFAQPEGYSGNIASEATEPEHAEWWVGVKTVRGGYDTPVSNETLTIREA